jgi:phenylacetate-CoA ligase
MRTSLRSLPGATWPFLPDESLSLLWSTFQSLESTQWLGPQELQRSHLAQVRQVLAHAVAQVPHYRERFSELGIVPAAVQSFDDLRRLPFVSKAEVQRNPMAFRSVTLPRGMVAAGANSTDAGLAIPQTNLTQLWWFAGTLRNLVWSRVDPAGAHATLRAASPLESSTSIFPSSPTWIPALDGLLRTGPAHAMRVDAEVREQWGWLRRVAPSLLTAPPSALRALASWSRETAEKLDSLQAIHVVISPLDEETRRLLADVFGVPIFESYARAEFGHLASTCPSGVGLHLHAENAIVEVLQDDDEPCGPGGKGRVVVTTLRNFLFPLIRYELGDEATLAAQPCACGRGLPLLAAMPRPREAPTKRVSVVANSSAKSCTMEAVKPTSLAISSGPLPVRSLPGNTWPVLPFPDVAQVWTAYQELEQTQWLLAEEIERRQLSQVRTLLEHCRDQVPYFQRQFAETNFDPEKFETLDDFRRLPLMERRIVKEHADALEARCLPDGMIATGDALTSGSSGVPLRVLQTNRVALWWFAFYLRDLVWGGFDLRARLAVIRSTGRKGDEFQKLMAGVPLPNWLHALRTLLETGTCHVLELGVDLPAQQTWLTDIDPDYLLSYPANLESLARMMGDSGAKLPRLKRIQSIGESLSPECRRVIEGAFGVAVHNLYSCAEAGYLASPCPAGEGLHVHAENVLLEVLDEEGQPCQPGETGRVAITTLHNFRMPFVRYLVGDEATVGPVRCGCGRGLPLLKEVHGKARPMYHLPGGGRKRCNKLAVFLQNLGGHLQHQVIQKTVDHVVVRLVPDQSWSEEHLRKLHAAMTDFFETTIHVDIELMDRIPLPASGKFQSMVCEIDSTSGGV